VTVLRWSGRLLAALPRDDAARRWRLAGLAGGVVANLFFATNHESFHFRHFWVLVGLVWAASQLVADEETTLDAVGQDPMTPRGLAHAGR
jgi:hypothetical protein